MPYINFNGNIYPEHEALLPVSNRAFKYGDGFFESMAMFNKKVPLMHYHWSRMEFTAQVLSAFLPSKLDADSLESMLLDLASVNDVAKNARVRMQFYRKGSGLFLPEEDELGYAITLDKIDYSKFEPGDGLTAGMRDDCYKAVSMISDIKNSSALAYVLATQFARAEGWDECILTNHYGQVCEGLTSNIFLVKGDRLITPDLDSGCVNGVMRSYLLWMMEDKTEEREVDVAELLDAEEILLVNAVKGIQWVKEFQRKTYPGKKAAELTAMLNEKLMIGK